MPSLRISGIVEESIVDGPGLRYVLFTQGCPHHCPGCHNPETHPQDGGFLMEVSDIVRQFCENPLLSGITFSGGEPFLQPAPLSLLARRIRALGKNVLVYSGYTHAQLQAMARTQPPVAALLAQLNTLIDGPYLESLRDLNLQFRGSSNQHILHLR